MLLNTCMFVCVRGERPKKPYGSTASLSYIFQNFYKYFYMQHQNIKSLSQTQTGLKMSRGYRLKPLHP